MSRGLVYDIDLTRSGEDAVRGSIETGGGPNGLALAPDGTVWVAQNGSAGFVSRSPRPVVPGLQRIDAAGVADVHVDDSVAPNDLAMGPDGAVWFTDPGADESRGLRPRVRRWDPVAATVTTVIEDMALPNGLAFSADGTELYVADSVAHRIVRYAVVGQGAAPAGVLAGVPDCGADGIAFDTSGRIYIAAFELDEIVVLAPDGAVERRIPTGPRSRPTNLCFAGENHELLVVTLASGGRVAVVEEEFEGLPL